ncbi:thioesterase II family protein [Streptomonospora salina]|uniref:Surfactin synthase thioesterase subunit n=1 Tax=Streptomonospora salina TaxID=104205 RepID=A0A841E7V9_9ACTN|nr:alpha/beta fold hydrolase [Streptomonospora salina]MBB6000037.1 surfactin synthase thioesterase subunit [Streptomonospora salina]
MNENIVQKQPRWLISRMRRPDAPIGLYCFPHAGGSPGEYVRWSDDLPNVQVWGVQLPGRGSRMSEPAVTRMSALVEQVLESVDFGERFALFGHSLGSLVAFEVARGLQARGRPLPQQLFVSSAPPPPSMSHSSRPLHTLPDDELLARVEAMWGALPSAVKTTPELLRVTMGPFRNDLAILETYVHEPSGPLKCSVTAFAGSQEAPIARDLSGWRDHTVGGFESHLLPGHHFYHREQRPALLRIVADSLRTGSSTAPEQRSA